METNRQILKDIDQAINELLDLQAKVLNRKEEMIAGDERARKVLIKLEDHFQQAIISLKRASLSIPLRK